MDEPINGLDADGMRIMREVLIDITKNLNCTVLISSHLLGELEKIATHYGIIRNGQMIKEMTAEELEKECPTYVAIKAKDNIEAKRALEKRYKKVIEENDELRVYDSCLTKDVVSYLYSENILPTYVQTKKIT